MTSNKNKEFLFVYLIKGLAIHTKTHSPVTNLFYLIGIIILQFKAFVLVCTIIVILCYTW